MSRSPTELVSSQTCGKTVSHGWPGCEWACHVSYLLRRPLKETNLRGSIHMYGHTAIHKCKDGYNPYLYRLGHIRPTLSEC
jgi:hypothetical protein